MNAVISAFNSHFLSQPGDSKELALEVIYFIYLLPIAKFSRKIILKEAN